MKASRTLIKDSLLTRSRSSAISAALRKTPLTLQPNVRVDHTLTLDAGHTQRIYHVLGEPERNPLRDFKGFALPLACIVPLCPPPLSNKQFKSTCTVSPVKPSKRIFSPCRSPSLPISSALVIVTHPRTYPIIDMTANVRAYAIRLASQAEGSGQVKRNHSWKTVGEYLISAAFPLIGSHWENLFFESLNDRCRPLLSDVLQQLVQLAVLWQTSVSTYDPDLRRPSCYASRTPSPGCF